ncbi:hypothetical protein [Rhodopseudomonas palustris]|uniref:Uncharacterized protein n=1 Tax=Rhodopseudomonas palustris TaxID=1076 RepID=A0A418V3A9_RHOPL|nr:hypothetical protein [Rhodopseudomonas palustris]RJF70573.1 hypothetical protein D4Q52_16050 [Rhodopseudomonas palustris]
MDEQRKEPISEDQAGAGIASSASAAAEGEHEAAAQASGADASAQQHEQPAAAANQVERIKDKAAAARDAERLGKVTIMAPPRHENWYRNWDDEIEVEAPDQPADAGRSHNKRQLALIAVAVVLAAFAGAAGGAFTNANLFHPGSSETATKAQTQARALDEQVAKLQTEVAALKASVDQAAKSTSAQIGKATDRLEKIEKAQAEPAQKIARLTETVEKLRTAQADKPAPAPAAPAPTQVASASQDITGTVSPKPVPKPAEVSRLPTVDGWVLRDVYDGGAVVVGREGTFEVYAGDPLPGLGRVDAIRRQDGRWVVVTSRGLIVAR